MVLLSGCFCFEDDVAVFVVGGGGAWLGAFGSWRRNETQRFAWLVGPIAIYAAISLTSHINIGIRHFLPVYPFLFIAGGALLAQLLRARRSAAIAVLAILLAG